MKRLMLRAVVAGVILLALAIFAPAPAAADGHIVTVTGMTEGGAYYKFMVPANWNGDLVIWNHGYSTSPPGPVNDMGPLADLQLGQGYALAASSYRLSQWAVFKTKNDLQNMYNAFVDDFGAPDEVIVTGGSLGGIVTAQAIEQANIGNVVGAYALCGAMAGSRNWDGAFDLRLIYDVVTANTPAAYIPGGPEGLPEDSSLTIPEIALAVNAGTGILTPAQFRTPTQQDNLDTLLEVTQIPENFLLTVMIYSTLNMSNLVHDTHKLNDRVGIGNIGVDYGNEFVNENIARIDAHPGAANRLDKYYNPTGDVGDVRIVSIHTDKDGLVIVENQNEYASIVPADNLTTAIVVEDSPTHCGFNPAEVIAGWESLRGWLAGAPQPSAASIQATCEAYSLFFEGPCRYDPFYIVADMDTRVRPR